MSIPEAATEEVPDDAVESVDDDANEVIMMDPKNFYMVYLLKTSAFLHSCIAFLMMISYYKLKVNDRSLNVRFSRRFVGPVGHFQTGEGNRPQTRIRGRLAHRSA